MKQVMFVIGLCCSLGMVSAANADELRTTPKGGSACAINSSSYIIRRGDAGFRQIASDLNGFVKSPRATFDKVEIPEGRSFIAENAEFIRIDAEVSSCSNLVAQSTNGDLSIGGCNYVGCTGSLPTEFDTMPIGSVVSLSSCGGGISTSGEFQKSSNGLWVMTSYSQERVTQCSPMGG